MARRSGGRVCMRLRIVVLFVIFSVALITWNAPVVSSQTSDEETPKDDVPTDDVPKDDVSKDDVPKDDGVKDEISKDDGPKDEVPEDDVPKDEVPKDDVPKLDGEKDGVQFDSEKDGKEDDEVIPETKDGTQKPEEVRTDLDPNGKCSEEIKTLCTKESESSLDCISKELMSVQVGVSSHSVSEGCKVEWRDLKVALYKDVTLSKKIMDVCEKDIEKSCSADYLPGGVLACLRSAKDELSQACQDEVFVVELDAVYDFTMDTLLSDTCQQDAAKYCKDVAPGEGRVQACLRSHTGDISYNCKTELFRQETENAGDIRLNVGLYKACLPDKEKFCSNVKPGNSRLKDCLESNRLKPDFSASCTTEFDKLLARRSADFRLNTRLKETCDKDIKLLCSEQFQDKGEIPNDEPAIIHCLQDYREALTSNECKNEVHKLLSLAAEDYRFDKEFSDSCEDAKQKFCKTTENDKVLSCLQGQRESLDNKCRAAVFTLEWRLSGDIDYKFAMKQACSVEIPKFCPGSLHDHGDTIECLQQHVSTDIEMREDCKKEILRDQVESAKDYRLNYRIYKDCRRDVDSLCEVPKVCKGAEPCGGVVLKCLQDNLDKLESDSCKQDIRAFELKETKNMELNIPLQTACKDALPKLCPRRRNQDHGKTLQCLRAHRSNLTDECKEEELRFSMMEASDIRLTPSLMNACGAEMSRFCDNVSPLNGESFKCLQLNLESVLMGLKCKLEVDLQGLRQASDYRLDVRVRTECKDDVKKFCSTVDKREDGHAPVLKCFLNQFRNLTRGCQTEVSYATRMALWQYKFGSDLTLPCDDTVRNSCNGTDSKDIDGVYIGSYGQCLTTLRKKSFDPACRRLVWVATREGFFIGNSTDADTAAALFKYNELRNADELSQSKMGLFWVTTGVCFVAILAVGLFRRYSGPPKTYTLVVKQGDI